jgi:hypothetical protein
MAMVFIGIPSQEKEAFPRRSTNEIGPEAAKRIVADSRRQYVNEIIITRLLLRSLRNGNERKKTYAKES